MSELISRLEAFRAAHKINGKGPLSVMVVVTEHAKVMGLPLDPKKLVTEEGGQVLGLGRTAVQAVLERHGISKVLAKEGGRTSRGSMGLMGRYVDFLNEINAEGLAEVDKIESWWIKCIKEHFDAGGFILNFDTAKSLRAIVEDLLAQAQKLQAQRRGATYVGAMLQHMVGAKLELALKTKLEHHGYSVADASTNRVGDFVLDDVILHVTANTGDGLIQKCQANLKSGVRPIIITTAESVAGAISLAKGAGIYDRVEVIDAGQFIAMNLYELSGFRANDRKITVESFVARYNQIVIDHETDPALKIAHDD